jgi:hypothetical protein
MYNSNQKLKTMLSAPLVKTIKPNKSGIDKNLLNLGVKILLTELILQPKKD